MKTYVCSVNLEGCDECSTLKFVSHDYDHVKSYWDTYEPADNEVVTIEEWENDQSMCLNTKMKEELNDGQKRIKY